MLDVLHSQRFVDQAPAAVYYTLLDEGVRFCSVRTMYRILDSQGEVRERRNQLTHPTYKKPELLATGPNQVWSWDITKLLGPVKWTYYDLNSPPTVAFGRRYICGQPTPRCGLEGPVCVVRRTSAVLTSFPTALRSSERTPSLHPDPPRRPRFSRQAADSG